MGQGVTKIVDLMNTFTAQCCMSVGKSGHERIEKSVCHSVNYAMKTMLSDAELHDEHDATKYSPE